MNLKKAKALRRIVRHHARRVKDQEGRVIAERAYLHLVRARVTYTNVVIGTNPDGTPIHPVLDHITSVNHPDTLRCAYRTLKRRAA